MRALASSKSKVRNSGLKPSGRDKARARRIHDGTRQTPGWPHQADLAELITAGMPELKTLEYKQTLSGTSDATARNSLPMFHRSRILAAVI